MCSQLLQDLWCQNSVPGITADRVGQQRPFSVRIGRIDRKTAGIGMVVWLFVIRLGDQQAMCGLHELLCEESRIGCTSLQIDDPFSRPKGPCKVFVGL